MIIEKFYTLADGQPVTVSVEFAIAQADDPRAVDGKIVAATSGVQAVYSNVFPISAQHYEHIQSVEIVSINGSEWPNQESNTIVEVDGDQITYSVIVDFGHKSGETPIAQLTVRKETYTVYDEDALDADFGYDTEDGRAISLPAGLRIAPKRNADYTLIAEFTNQPYWNPESWTVREGVTEITRKEYMAALRGETKASVKQATTKNKKGK